jgi:uncharacterized protein Usg
MIITLQFHETNQTLYFDGKSVIECSIKVFEQLKRDYDIWPEYDYSDFFEAFTQFERARVDGDQFANRYMHSDMSCPEDAWILTCYEIS